MADPWRDLAREGRMRFFGGKDEDSNSDSEDEQMASMQEPARANPSDRRHPSEAPSRSPSQGKAAERITQLEADLKTKESELSVALHMATCNGIPLNRSSNSRIAQVLFGEHGERLKSWLDTAQAEADELKQNAASARADAEAFQAQKSAAEADADDVRARLAEVELEAVELGRKVSTQEGEVAELRRKLGSAEDDVQELRRRVFDAEAEAEDVRRQNARGALEGQDLEARLARAEAERDHLKRRALKHEEEMQEQLSKVGVLESEANDLRWKLERAEEDAEQQRKALVELKTSTKEGKGHTLKLQGQLKTAQEAIGRLEEEANKCRAATQAATERAGRLQRELADISQKAPGTEKSLASQRSAMADMERQLDAVRGELLEMNNRDLQRGRQLREEVKARLALEQKLAEAAVEIEGGKTALQHADNLAGAQAERDRRDLMKAREDVQNLHTQLEREKRAATVAKNEAQEAASALERAIKDAETHQKAAEKLRRELDGQREEVERNAKAHQDFKKTIAAKMLSVQDHLMELKEEGRVMREEQGKGQRRVVEVESLLEKRSVQHERALSEMAVQHQRELSQVEARYKDLLSQHKQKMAASQAREQAARDQFARAQAKIEKLARELAFAQSQSARDMTSMNGGSLNGHTDGGGEAAMNMAEIEMAYKTLVAAQEEFRSQKAILEQENKLLAVKLEVLTSASSDPHSPRANNATYQQSTVTATPITASQRKPWNASPNLRAASPHGSMASTMDSLEEATLKAKYANAVRDRKRIEAAMQDLLAVKDRRQGEVKELMQTIEDQQAQVQSLTKQLKEAGKDREALQAKLDASSQAVSQSQDDRSQLQGEIEALRKKIGELEERSVEMRKEMRVLEDTTALSSSRERQLGQKVEALTQHNGVLQMQVRDAHKRVLAESDKRVAALLELEQLRVMLGDLADGAGDLGMLLEAWERSAPQFEANVRIVAKDRARNAECSRRLKAMADAKGKESIENAAKMKELAEKVSHLEAMSRDLEQDKERVAAQWRQKSEQLEQRFEDELAKERRRVAELEAKVRAEEERSTRKHSFPDDVQRQVAEKHQREVDEMRARAEKAELELEKVRSDTEEQMRDLKQTCEKDKEMLESTQDAVREASEREKEDLRRQLEIERQDREDLQQGMTLLSKRNQDLEGDKEVLEQRIREREERESSELKRLLAESQASEDEVKNILRDERSKLQEMSQTADILSSMVSKLKQRVLANATLFVERSTEGHLATVFELFVNQVRLEALKVRLSDATDQQASSNKRVPSQPLTGGSSASLVGSIDEGPDEVDHLRESLTHATADKNRLQAELNDALLRLDDAEDELEELRQELDGARNRDATQEERGDRSKEELLAVEELEELQTTLKSELCASEAHIDALRRELKREKAEAEEREVERQNELQSTIQAWQQRDVEHKQLVAELRNELAGSIKAFQRLDAEHKEKVAKLQVDLAQVRMAAQEREDQLKKEKQLLAEFDQEQLENLAALLHQERTRAVQNRAELSRSKNGGVYASQGGSAEALAAGDGSLVNIHEEYLLTGRQVPATSGPWEMRLQVLEAKNLPPIAKQGVFACASLISSDMHTSGGAYLLPEHTLPTDSQLKKGAAHGLMRTLKPQLTTQVTPSSNASWYSATKLETLQTRTLDGQWSSSDLAGQPVVVLVSVHGEEDELIGRVAVPMGSTQGVLLDQLFELRSKDGEIIRNTAGMPSELRLRLAYGPAGAEYDQSPPPRHGRPNSVRGVPSPVQDLNAAKTHTRLHDSPNKADLSPSFPSSGRFAASPYKDLANSTISSQRAAAMSSDESVSWAHATVVTSEAKGRGSPLARTPDTRLPPLSNDSAAFKVRGSPPRAGSPASPKAPATRKPPTEQSPSKATNQDVAHNTSPQLRSTQHPPVSHAEQNVGLLPRSTNASQPFENTPATVQAQPKSSTDASQPYESTPTVIESPVLIPLAPRPASPKLQDAGSSFTLKSEGVVDRWTVVVGLLGHQNVAHLYENSSLQVVLAYSLLLPDAESLMSSHGKMDHAFGKASVGSRIPGALILTPQHVTRPLHLGGGPPRGERGAVLREFNISGEAGRGQPVELDGKGAVVLITAHVLDSEGRGASVGRALVPLHTGEGSQHWVQLFTPTGAHLQDSSGSPSMLLLHLSYHNQDSSAPTRSPVIPSAVCIANTLKLLRNMGTTSQDWQDAPQLLRLPDGWRWQRSRSTGKVFYHHKSTGTTAWRPPEGTVYPDASKFPSNALKGWRLTVKVCYAVDVCEGSRGLVCTCSVLMGDGLSSSDLLQASAPSQARTRVAMGAAQPGGWTWAWSDAEVGLSEATLIMEGGGAVGMSALGGQVVCLMLSVHLADGAEDEDASSFGVCVGSSLVALRPGAEADVWVQVCSCSTGLPLSSPSGRPVLLLLQCNYYHSKQTTTSSLEEPCVLSPAAARHLTNVWGDIPSGRPRTSASQLAPIRTDGGILMGHTSNNKSPKSPSEVAKMTNTSLSSPPPIAPRGVLTPSGSFVSHSGSELANHTTVSSSEVSRVQAQKAASAIQAWKEHSASVKQSLHVETQDAGPKTPSQPPSTNSTEEAQPRYLKADETIKKGLTKGQLQNLEKRIHADEYAPPTSGGGGSSAIREEIARAKKIAEEEKARKEQALQEALGARGFQGFSPAKHLVSEQSHLGARRAPDASSTPALKPFPAMSILRVRMQEAMGLPSSNGRGLVYAAISAVQGLEGFSVIPTLTHANPSIMDGDQVDVIAMAKSESTRTSGGVAVWDDAVDLAEAYVFPAHSQMDAKSPQMLRHSALISGAPLHVFISVHEQVSIQADPHTDPCLGNTVVAASPTSDVSHSCQLDGAKSIPSPSLRFSITYEHLA